MLLIRVLQDRYQGIVCADLLGTNSNLQVGGEKVACFLGIAHFQKEWKPGTRMGARWIMGSFGGTRLKTNARASPANDPIIEHVPTVALGFHSFWKWAIAAYADTSIDLSGCHAFLPNTRGERTRDKPQEP